MISKKETYMSKHALSFSAQDLRRLLTRIMVFLLLLGSGTAQAAAISEGNQTFNIGEDVPHNFSLTTTGDLFGTWVVGGLDVSEGTIQIFPGTFGDVCDFTFFPAPNRDTPPPVSFNVTYEHFTGNDSVSITYNIAQDNADAPIIGPTPPLVTLAEDPGSPVETNMGANDPDGDTDLDWTITNQPDHGSASFNDATGQTAALDYTPALNYNGPDSLEVTVTDSTGRTATRTINYSISAVADPPVISTPNVVTSTNEDTLLTFNVTASDPDQAASTLTWQVSNPANGTASATSPAATTTVSYTPDEDYFGSDTFTITVLDNTAIVDSITATITVNSVDDPPVITQGASTIVTMDEDGNPVAFSLTLTVDDPDSTNAQSTWSLASPPSNGTVAGFGTGDPDVTGKTFDVPYTANTGYFGPDAFNLTVTDQTGLSDSISVQVTVREQQEPTITPIQTLPVMIDENENPTPFVLELAFDDDITPNNQLVWTVSDDPDHGTADITINGTTLRAEVDYTPDFLYNGTDQFTVRLTDQSNRFTELVVDVDIMNQPDAPIIVEGATTTITIDEDVPEAFTLSAGDTDSAEADLTWTVDVAPTSGTVQLDSTASAANSVATFTYSPALNVNGVAQDSFTVKVEDPDGTEDTIAVSVDITPVNDDPVFAPGNEQVTIDEDTQESITLNASDIEDTAGPLTFAIEDDANKGTIDLAIVQPLQLTLTYTPDPDAFSQPGVVFDVFTISVEDSQGGKGLKTIEIFVDAINDAPVIVSAAYKLSNIQEDEVNNAGSTIASIIGSDPAKPDPVTDSDPLAQEGLAITAADTTLGSWEFSLNGTGNDWQAFPAVSTTQALLLPAASRVRLVPAQDQRGSVSTALSFFAWDQTSGTAGGTVDIDDVSVRGNATAYSLGIQPGNLPATASIVVLGVNDAPVTVDDPDAAPFAFEVDEDRPAFYMDVLANDTDVEGGVGVGAFDIGNCRIARQAENGTASFITAIETIGGLTGQAGNVKYIPQAEFNGFDEFEYLAVDKGDTPANPPASNPIGRTAKVTVKVVPVNDPPSVKDDLDTVLAGESVEVDVLQNDSDPDPMPIVDNDPFHGLDPATIEIVTAPLHGTTSIDPVTGLVTYTPGVDFGTLFDADTFTYRVKDRGIDNVELGVTRAAVFPSAPAKVTIILSEPSVTVDTLTDVDDLGQVVNDGLRSLREAFRVVSDGGTVVFDETLLFPGGNPGQIFLGLGELVADRSFTLDGPGAEVLTVSGANLGRLVTVAAGTLTIQDLTLTEGAATQLVGGLPEIGGNGGAISVEAGASLIVDNCVVSESSATGALDDGIGNGGAIAHFGTAVTLRNSTFHDNSAAQHGGAVHSEGGLVIENCTFAYNEALAGDGGAVTVRVGDARVTHATVAFNTANTGGGLDRNGGTLTVENSLIVGNTASGAGPQVNGEVASGGVNLIESIDDSTGWTENDITDILATETVETTLIVNSPEDVPSTPTLALLGDSPAIDEADAAVAADRGLTGDQRGFNRVQNGTPDIGAYEIRRFSVSTNADTNRTTVDGSESDLSLREAIGLTLRGDNVDVTATGTLTLDAGIGPLNVERGIALRGQQDAPFNLNGNDATGLIEILNSDAQVIFEHIAFSNGVNTQQGGGAIYTFGSVTVRDCDFIDNAAPTGDGGAVHNRGNIQFVNCTWSNNSAGNSGGAMVNWGQSMELESCQVQNLLNGEIDSQLGGGVANLLGGTLSVADTTIEGCEANTGGAIHNAGTSTLRLVNSVLTANVALSDGAGIYNLGVLVGVNSTLSANTSTRHGGGLYQSGSNGSLTNCTLAHNESDSVGTGIGDGGGIYVNGGNIKLQNTLVALNADSDLNNPQGNIHPDLSGLAQSLGNNFIGIATGSSGLTNGALADQVGNSTSPLDPLLDALSDNGGPTLTHMPLVKSPCIDAGANSAVNAPPFPEGGATDQRGTGFARIVNGDKAEEAVVDIGAVELVPQQPTIAFDDPAGSDVATEDVLYSESISVADANLGESFIFTSTDMPVWLTLDGDESGTATVEGTFTNEHLAPTFITATYDFTITVEDVAGVTTDLPVSILVTGVNDPPTAQNDILTTDEDTAASIKVLDNDSDVDGILLFSRLDIVAEDMPEHGTATVDVNTGAISYLPDADFNGTDEFSYRITDNGAPTPAEFSIGTVSVTVNPLNDPPAVVGDVATLDEDGTIAVDVLANDTDVDGALVPASVIVTTQPIKGTVVVNNGVISYTGNANANGTDSFQYRVTDDGSPSPAALSTGTVDIAINAVNDAPNVSGETVTVIEDTPLNVNVLSNDTDVDGQLLGNNVTIVTQPTHGTATINPASGVITYTPNTSFSGLDTLVYSVTDNGSPTPALSSNGTINFTVTAVNDAPATVDDVAVTDEDTAIVISVLENDNDVDGNLVPGLLLVSVAPLHGTTSVDPIAGTITYTPNNNYNGNDTFGYQITDDGAPTPAATGTANVAVTVNAINDPPAAQNDAVTTPEDTPVTVPVLGNDTDVDGSIVASTVAIVTPPANGTVEISQNGSIVYSPEEDFNGTDTVVYSVSDDGSPLPEGTSQATLTVTMQSLNDAPNLVADDVTTDEDVALAIDVLENDEDVDGQMLLNTLLVVAQPANGSTSVNQTTGVITYTPKADFNGTDTFMYEITDNGSPTPSKASTANVTITVNPINDAPRLTNDTATTLEDTAATVPVFANDIDVDGALVAASVIITRQPIRGTVSVNAQNGAITYTPNQNINGTDNFQYTVTDDGAPLPVLSSNAQVNLTITAVNDAPATATDLAGGIEDTPVIIPVLVNDLDVDGTLLPATVLVVQAPQHGSTSVDTATGNITYTPAADYNGSDSFVYEVTDSGLPLPSKASTGTVNITLAPVNDAPRLNADSATADEDEPVTINVLANDSDVDGQLVRQSLVIETAPANGQATVNANGSITYAADPDFNGVDTFSYRITDDGSPTPVLSSVAQVQVLVTALNDAPAAVDDVVNGTEDTPLAIAVLDNDLDVDGALVATSVVVVQAPQHGTTAVDAAGVVTYTPSADFNGTDSFVYQVADDGSPLPVESSTATAHITIASVNDAPRTSADFAETNEDTAVTVDVLANDSDVDGSLLPGSVEVDAAPGNGSLSIAATGTITYTPNENFNGSDTFAYRVTDDGAPAPGLTTIEEVTVVVRAINDAPNATDDSRLTNEDTPVTVNVLVNDSDVDGTLVPASLTIVQAPAQGTAAVAAGAITYTPPVNFNGSVAIRYRISDNGSPLPAQSSEANLSIVVRAVNDAPAVQNDFAETDEDTPVVIAVLANDSDVDAPLDPASVTIEAAPLNGQATVNPTTGAITYTPNVDFNGTDSITYRVFDSGTPLPAASATGQVLIQVGAVNDNLTAVDDTASTAEDTAVAIEVLANDSDLDGDVMSNSVAINANPQHGTVSVDTATGVITYTPVENYNGADSFDYVVFDSGTPEPTTFDIGTVNVTVTAVNDAPVVSLEADYAGNQDEALALAGISVSDVDLVETEGATVEVTLAVTQGTLEVTAVAGASISAGANGSGSLTLTGAVEAVNATIATASYTGNSLYYGPDTLTLTADDLGSSGAGGAQTTIVTASILVDPVTMVVTTLQDLVDGNFSAGNVSLREALAEVEVGGVITFDAAVNGNLLLDSTQGALVIDHSLTIEGPGSGVLTIAADQNHRALLVDDGSEDVDTTVQINGISISDGNAGSENGGAILSNDSLVLQDVRIRNSNAVNGGGIYTTSTLTVDTVIGAGNVATAAGGFIGTGAEASVTVLNSTVANNSALDGGGIASSGALTVFNSTISGNSATGSGGGINSTASTAGLVLNTTVLGNTADSDSAENGNGGGIAVLTGAAGVTLANTIAAGNMDMTPVPGAVHNDLSGSFTAQRNNIIGSPTGAMGVGFPDILLSERPELPLSAVIETSLGENGGLTPTHLPRPYGLAVSAGDTSALSLLPFSASADDQRGEGFARIVRDIIDIGAVELQSEAEGFTVTIDLAEGQPSLSAFLPARFLVTFSEIVTGFSADLVVNTGTSDDVVFAVTQLDAFNFNLSVTSATPGTIVPLLPASSLTDPFLVPNPASTGTNQVFTYNPARDADGDTVLDLDEGQGDADSDGVPNFLDEDSDNDGVPDFAEALAGSDAYAPGAPDSVLVVSPTSLSFGAEGGSAEVTITHFGSDITWTVGTSADWAVASGGGTNGGSATVTVTASGEALERSASLIISAPGASISPVPVTLVQAPGCPNKLPAPTNALASFGGGELTVSWDPVPGAEQYLVFRSVTDLANAEQVGTVVETSFTVDAETFLFCTVGDDPRDYNYWVFGATAACGAGDGATVETDFEKTLGVKTSDARSNACGFPLLGGAAVQQTNSAGVFGSAGTAGDVVTLSALLALMLGAGGAMRYTRWYSQPRASGK